MSNKIHVCRFIAAAGSNRDIDEHTVHYNNVLPIKDSMYTAALFIHGYNELLQSQ